MENQTRPLGISSVAWVVIGIVALVIVVGALLAMMFGMDVGGVLS